MKRINDVLDHALRAHEAAHADEANRRIGELILAIWQVACRAGIANGDVPPDGPGALLLCEDIGEIVDVLRRDRMQPLAAISGGAS